MRALVGWAVLACSVSMAALESSCAPARHTLEGTEEHAPALAECARCHRGRLPATHDEDFLTRSHGARARADRDLCLGCHQETGCRACHQTRQPEWHGEAFRSPGRGVDGRKEHGRMGAKHGESCLECHDHRFHRQCSQCHQRGDWL